jgi:hypothetical protein
LLQPPAFSYIPPYADTKIEIDLHTESPEGQSPFGGGLGTSPKSVVFRGVERRIHEQSYPYLQFAGIISQKNLMWNRLFIEFLQVGISPAFFNF